MTFQFPVLTCYLFNSFGCFLRFFCFYPRFLGWLFGSYTVLRWRRLPLQVLTQRLFITSSVTLFVVVFALWLFSPGDAGLLEHRWVHVVWFWFPGSLVDLCPASLRRGLLLPEPPRLLLLPVTREIFVHSPCMGPRQTFFSFLSSIPAVGFGETLE